MNKRGPLPAVQPPASEDENDTEGQAFAWRLVDDPKGGKRLRQSWSPDDPPPGRPARAQKQAERRTDAGR